MYRKAVLIQGISDELMTATGIGPVIGELRNQENIIAVILFGSVARGNAGTLSDIDLCIVTSREISESEKHDLLSYGSRKIDVSLFYDLPLTIRFRVLREGKLLFCRDSLTFHRIVTKTVRQYLDSASLIRKHSLHAIRVPL
jgi:Predicted nucleotidyltransferases